MIKPPRGVQNGCGGCGDGDVYGGEYIRVDGDEGGDWHRDGDERAGGD